MRVGLISDTHDHLPAIRAALELFERQRIDTLIHPGDLIAPFAARLLAAFPGTVYATYGNNDGERAGLKAVLPQIQDGPLWLNLHGRRVLVHHFIDWCRTEDIDAAELVVTGHTHAVQLERRGDARLINPGECCGWVSGRCTVGVLNLATGETDIIEIKP